MKVTYLFLIRLFLIGTISLSFENLIVDCIKLALHNVLHNILEVRENSKYRSD